MYIYMGMFFNSQQDVPDFGSIAMYYVGTKDLGYVEEGHKRFRKYTFQSTDLNKLSLITNAIDGSEAFAVDTGTTYVLYDGEWSIKSSELTPTKMAEILGDITSIDYQVVTVLPTTGIKGTIYLVNHSHGENDIYDEYIWINGAYEKIGNTDVDLRNYIPVVTGANNKVPKFNSEGKLTSSGFELNKTVPSDAIFTDTTYTTMTGATNNANGTSGLVPAPTATQQNYYLSGDGTWKNSNPILYLTLQQATARNWTTDNKIDLNKITTRGFYWIPPLPNLPIVNYPANSNITEYNGIYLQVKQFNKGVSYDASDDELTNGLTSGTQILQYYVEDIKQIYRRNWIIEDYQNDYFYNNFFQQYGWEKVEFIQKYARTAGQIPKFTSDGDLSSTGFTLGKSVPSNAVFTDTTYNVVTQSTDGLMSSTDKTKLDGITISDYLRKDDIVTLTSAEYEALVTKTAPYYFITDV